MKDSRLKRKTKDWDRFWSKVEKGPGCWEWQAARLSYGYGIFNLKGKSQYTHRMVYEMGHGKIPEGMYVCHRCDVPSCVRPSHLFLGTPKENQQDSSKKGRLKRAYGENSGCTHLTEKDVKAIRADQRPQRMIATEYNMTHSAIGYIKRRKVWKHIK